jgi:hypothetical protein
MQIEGKQIRDESIELDKLVQAIAGVLIGRRSGSAGAYEVITLGSGLSMSSGGVLSASGGGGGGYSYFPSGWG